MGHGMEQECERPFYRFQAILKLVVALIELPPWLKSKDLADRSTKFGRNFGKEYNNGFCEKCITQNLPCTYLPHL